MLIVEWVDATLLSTFIPVTHAVYMSRENKYSYEGKKEKKKYKVIKATLNFF